MLFFQALRHLTTSCVGWKWRVMFDWVFSVSCPTALLFGPALGEKTLRRWRTKVECSWDTSAGKEKRKGVRRMRWLLIFLLPAK